MVAHGTPHPHHPPGTPRSPIRSKRRRRKGARPHGPGAPSEEARRFALCFLLQMAEETNSLISDISVYLYLPSPMSSTSPSPYLHPRFNSSLSLVDLSRFSRISRRGGLIIKKSELGAQLFKIQKGRPKLNVCSTTWHLAYAPCFKLWK